jgi:predicted negative regulator of RcsB-dependent stress response/thiol-disulfide isomerase/thioredoxin
MKKTMSIGAIFALCFALGLTVSNQAFAQTRQEQPPEYKELVAASQLKDTAARLKEFERIKAAYPKSVMMASIDMSILDAKVELSDTLEAILGLQKDSLGQGQGPRRMSSYFVAVSQILEHSKLKTFDKAKVMAVVLKYKEDLLKVAADPETFKGISEQQQKSAKQYYLTGFDIFVAKAHLNAGDAEKALAALDAYQTAGGAADGQFAYTRGDALEKLGRAKDAYDAYLAAAVENYEDAAIKAKVLYAKVNGKADGFEAALEAKLKSLPYHPEAFKTSADWKGKAVLAELFTGSECPPCVGADLGFDGLIESYPTKYLAVLEYHLPIPRPDPMMNPATKKRQDTYGVNSTPTVVIDGDKKMVGGGSRGMAEGKYKEYKAEIEARINAAPAVALKLKAARSGDTVKVDYEFDKVVAGAEYHVVLVQAEEQYKGSNGLQFHKLVVRDIVTVDPAAAKQASFDLLKSEQAADQYLTDFEKTYTRVPNFKWTERHFKIDRSKLGVVFFVQEKETKKVLNAVVAEVK